MKFLRSLFLLLLSLSFISACSFTPLKGIEVKRASQPDIRPVPVADTIFDDFNYRLEQSWYFYFTIDGVEYRDSVPEGWLTDGTSVPRSVWSFFGITRDGLERGASWGHDWLYVNRGTIYCERIKNDEWVPVYVKLSREDVDNIFYQTLLDLHISSKRAQLMFDGVRKFGGSAWENHREKAMQLNGLRK